MATTGSPTNSSTSSPPALFATDIANNFVELKNVILNEFHVLRKFSLISLCDQALRVTLDSDLSSQICFQLNNENIDNTDENSGAEPVVATFLADDFSELFNTVNLVNEVILQPRQVQQVILTFRPLESSSDASEQEGDFKNAQQGIDLSSDAKIQEDGAVEPPSKVVYPRANQSIKVTGMVFLSATVFNDNTRTQIASTSDKGIDSRQDIVIHFQSTVCRSILKADVPDIVFDDCVPGGVFVKDFSIWNLSEVPCAFQLHVKNGQAEQPSLDLTDYETGLPVTNGEIKSCAHRRIRVMYKPREVGDFSYSIHLENSFDVRNSTCIPVQCIVNAEHRQEGLLVTGVGEDGVLDFGDCFANNGTCQMLTLRNITHEALVVNLGTDHSPGDKVNFYLQTELDMSSGSAQSYAYDADNQEQVPLKTEDETSSVPGLRLGDSLGTRVNFDNKNRIEELSLGRGEEKNLLVWFYAAGQSDETKAPRLQRRTFRLSLKCVEKKGRSKQRFSNILQCKARVCTSIVKLSTPEINFGDCNIGSQKSASVEIMNLSDLPALVTSYVTSTVLSFKSKAERVLISPRQSYSLEIDLVPLKINPKYRKQITIDNFYNKDNQQVIEVRAKIMDRHHVLLHSLYYKLLTPSTNNFLNFDCVIVNNPSIRTLAIENITDKSLLLGFNTSMPEELGIYQLRDDSQSEAGDDTCSTFSDGSEEDSHESRRRAYAALMNKEKLLETLEESQPRLSKAIVDSAPFPVQHDHKSIPPRPPFTASKRKARMRMSLDLATSSSFTSNGGEKTLSLVSPVSGSPSGGGESKMESLAVKPFGHSGNEHGPRPLKRVQSSAMLSAVEEIPNVVSDTSQEEVSPEGIVVVLKRLSDHMISNCSFADEEAEKQYVENQIKDRDLLLHVLEDLPRTLTPVRKLEILPGETKLLYVLLTVEGPNRPSIQGRFQKLTAKVNIQLLEYDKERQELVEGGFVEPVINEDLLTRELPVYCRVCRALLSLAQKNISFGKLLTNEHRAKTLVLTNISDAPLLYKLKKTGSIASGDLHIINGRTGILRPHSDREVNFVFQPSLGGSFHETLVVSNIYDPSNDQVVTLKATISRADTFWLNTSSIDFGGIIVGEWSRPQSIVIVNNSKQSRTFVVKEADFASDDKVNKPMLDGTTEGSRVLRFMVEEKQKRSSQAAVGPEQELIEALERKGLAYERKGKADKAAKIRKQIDELRAQDSSAILAKKDMDRGGSEGSKHERSQSSGETESHLHFSPEVGIGPSLDQNLGRTCTSSPKGSDGYLSLTLKGGDSKAVLVSILSVLSTSAPLTQRIRGNLVAYESKNQDVMKKVGYEATVLQSEPLRERDVSGTLNASPFNLKLRTPTPETTRYPTLLPPSPSISPESSAPASPVGAYTPQSAAAQTLSRTSSPDLSSSISHFDEHLVVSEKAGGVSSASRNLATSFAQALDEDAWGSNHHILQWDEDGEGLASMDNISDSIGVDEDDGSRSESCSGMFGFEPLFKIELLQQSQQQAAGLIEPRDGDDDMVLDLSSAADLARSLVCHKIQELGKAVFAGELILEDSSQHDRREASISLRSLSNQDIWIQFHLAWDGEPDFVELWTSNLEEAAVASAEDEYVTSLSTASSSTHIQWEQAGTCGSTEDEGMFSSSLLLKGGAVTVVTLIRPDDSPELDVLKVDTNADATDNGGVSEGYEKKVQATGVLTMQARPDDGFSQQLLVRVKQLDRCIKVDPLTILFPESDLSTVLTQDLTIKNRIGVSLTYTSVVTGAKEKSPQENLVGLTDHLAGSLNELTEFLPPGSCESVLSVYPVEGRIEGHGSITVKVTGRPLKPGKQSYEIHLQSSACLQETQVNITMLPNRVHCLYLPDLADGGTLDMGFCYMNAPCGEKVVPLRLQNLASESLLLSFRSNLARQVYISSSSQTLKRTDELLIAGGASTTVFMCLRPGGDATAFEGGQCREIIGGMRITARSVFTGDTTPVGGGISAQEKSLDEIMVKFRAIVGRSLMQVSTSMIDLGRVRVLGGFITGKFLVSNPSSQMPLHFSLTSKKAILSVSEGHLAGKEAARFVGHFEKSDMSVKFSLPVIDFGLIEDRVVVQNLSCPGQTAELVLRLFVDAGVVEATADEALPHCQNTRDERFSLSLDPGSPSASNEFTSVRQIRSFPFGSHGRGRGGGYGRQIRKTASVGDFYFANLLAHLGKTEDLTYSQAESFAGVKSGDVSFLKANSILHLGTVFMSPGDRGSANARSSQSQDLSVPSFSITDLRPYHSSLLITSHFQEAIQLEPFSNLPVLVDSDQALVDTPQFSTTLAAVSRHYDPSIGESTDFDKSYVGSEVYMDGRVSEALILGGSSEFGTKFTPCGRTFVVDPGCTKRIFVKCAGLPQMSPSEIDHLGVGEIFTVEGLLLFVKKRPAVDKDSSNLSMARHRSDVVNLGDQAVEVLNVVASLCISKGKLARGYVDLGKVGYANRWADVEFEFTVENVSDAVLVYQLVDVPDFFTISKEETPTWCGDNKERKRCVVPRSSSTLKVTLCTSKLEHVKEAGPCSWRICLLNCNNPHNLMELLVEAEMTVCNLLFGGLTESALLLPPLTLPALPSAPPCIAQFVVENLSLESLGVALQLQQAEETESLVMLEIISQENTTIGELTLGPGERTELRVCAHPISDNIPSHFLAQNVSNWRTPGVDSDNALSSVYWEKFAADIPRNITGKSSSSQELRSTDFEQADSEVEAEENRTHLKEDFELASTVCLGQLYLFSSPHLPDCIAIHGALLPGCSFDVSPRTLHLQARLGETGTPQRVPSSEDIENVNKLGAPWEGRHESTGTSQVVIRNFRAFESLQFSVRISDSDQVIPNKILFDFVSIQPVEGSIPPHGSAEISVKARPWSRDVYDHLRSSGGEIRYSDPLTIALSVQDVEGHKADQSSERVLVRIRPPADIQNVGVEGALVPMKALSRNLSCDKKEATRASQGCPIVLGLRGCTPVGGSQLCFEFNLGQQNISSGGRLNWDLTLVGDKAWPIQYRLGTISEGDAKWLTISRPNGLVEASQQTTVQLRFSTKAMGVYSTYLVVENLENPADLKTVHLSLEVVAPRNARPEAPSLTFFHVLVQGNRSEGMVIDMGEVYYNFWYRNRSFAVVNEAPVAMEFLLSSSLDQNESTELNFSLANTSLKRFSSITLGAKSSLRIWIHFCPGPAKEEPITEDTCDEMSASIYVNCRLVKDYQRCIPFRARCRYPQIGISTTDIVFSTRRQRQSLNSNWVQEDPVAAAGENISGNGPVNAPLIESVAVVGSTGVQCLMPVPAELAYQSVCGKSDENLPVVAVRDLLASQSAKTRREDDMDLLPALQMLVIRNLYAHRPLQYLVKNDSLFFAADFPEPQVVQYGKNVPGKDTEELNGPSQTFHVILVRPNMENLRVHQKSILKQKYVEEHLTIYNRSNPREKYTVSLRITAGHLRNFFAAPGRKNSYPFNRLELLITSFLSKFYSLTSRMLGALAQGNSHTVTTVDAKFDIGRGNDGSSEGSGGIKSPLRNRQAETKFQALEECLESLRAGSHVSTDYESLYFDFHYLTDELVFYCLKERWSRGGGTLELATVQLAKLLYCALYRCQIFEVCRDSCQNFSSLGTVNSLAPEDQAREGTGEGANQNYSALNLKNGAGELNGYLIRSGAETSSLELGELIPPPKQSLKFLQDWTGQLRHFLSFFPDSREDLIPLRELNQKNQDVITACRSASNSYTHSLMYRS